MATITTSNQYSLNWKDIFKGLIVAVITPVFTIIMTSLNAGVLTFDWKAIGATAAAAALAYLLKNFLTPSAIVIDAPPSQVQAVKDGEATVTVRPT
jgi:hypothetical protein